MKYEVIENFTDLQDKNHRYQAGDKFPRDGYEASARRIDELLTDKNRRHRAMIKAIEEPEPAVESKADPKAESAAESKVEPAEPVEVPKKTAPKKGKKKKDVE